MCDDDPPPDSSEPVSDEALDSLCRGMLGERFNLLEGIRLDAACEEKEVVVAIEAASRDANLAGTLTLAPTGNYDLQLTARPTVAELRELFLDLGFQQSQGLLRLQRRGQLR